MIALFAGFATFVKIIWIEVVEAMILVRKIFYSANVQVLFAIFFRLGFKLLIAIIADFTTRSSSRIWRVLL